MIFATLFAISILVGSSLCSTGLKILAFLPIPTKSHQSCFSPIFNELVTRGHHVVYITPQKPKFLHQNLHVRLLRPYLPIFNKKYDFVNMGLKSIPAMIHHRFSVGVDMAEYFYGDPVVKDLIHGNESFDAVIMESHCFQEPVSALIHKFGCPAIEVSSLGDLSWINELSGHPDNTAFQMDVKTPFSDKMTFLERLYNTYVTWSTVLISYCNLYRMQRVMDKYFNYTGWESRPSIYEMVSNRSLILINREINVATYPFPAAPHVKNIGGLNILPNKPLRKDIQTFMDEAKDGVIYFSLGSNLKTSGIFLNHIGDAFLTVFKEISQKILIKWESDDNVTLPQNVKTSKWFSQQDVLAHKNCRVFITHGGLMGLTESVYHAVPLLGIPFFWDQFKNLKQVETAGYGLVLDKNNISIRSVSWALEELLHNPKYNAEVERRSKMMRDKRHSPLEDAVYWIEYAIKYPNTLTPTSTKLSFIQLHMIDVYFFLLIIMYIFCKVLYNTVIFLSIYL